MRSLKWILFMLIAVQVSVAQSPAHQVSKNVNAPGSLSAWIETNLNGHRTTWTDTNPYSGVREQWEELVSATVADSCQLTVTTADRTPQRTYFDHCTIALREMPDAAFSVEKYDPALEPRSLRISDHVLWRLSISDDAQVSCKNDARTVRETLTYIYFTHELEAKRVAANLVEKIHEYCGKATPAAPQSRSEPRTTNDSSTVSRVDTDVQRRIKVDPEVTTGRLIRKVQPDYPQLAKQARISGAVVLEAVIGKDGSIENLHAISGHPMLIQSAIDAVRQWKYKPYLLNGEPVEVDTQVTVNFFLAGG